eukprot:PhM_4_TR2192/c0_g1_i1/m.41663
MYTSLIPPTPTLPSTDYGMRPFRSSGVTSATATATSYSESSVSCSPPLTPFRLSFRLCSGANSTSHHAYPVDGIVIEDLEVSSPEQLCRAIQHRLEHDHAMQHIEIGGLDVLIDFKVWMGLYGDTLFTAWDSLVRLDGQGMLSPVACRVLHVRRIVLLAHTRVLPLDTALPAPLRAPQAPRRVVAHVWELTGLRRAVAHAMFPTAARSNSGGGPCLPSNVQIAVYTPSKKMFIPATSLSDIQEGFAEVAFCTVGFPYDKIVRLDSDGATPCASSTISVEAAVNGDEIALAPMWTPVRPFGTVSFLSTEKKKANHGEDEYDFYNNGLGAGSGTLVSPSVPSSLHMISHLDLVDRQHEEEDRERNQNCLVDGPPDVIHHQSRCESNKENVEAATAPTAAATTTVSARSKLFVEMSTLPSRSALSLAHVAHRERRDRFQHGEDLDAIDAAGGRFDETKMSTFRAEESAAFSPRGDHPSLVSATHVSRHDDEHLHPCCSVPTSVEIRRELVVLVKHILEKEFYNDPDKPIGTFRLINLTSRIVREYLTGTTRPVSMPFSERVHQTLRSLIRSYVDSAVDLDAPLHTMKLPTGMLASLARAQNKKNNGDEVDHTDKDKNEPEVSPPRFGADSTNNKNKTAHIPVVGRLAGYVPRAMRALGANQPPPTCPDFEESDCGTYRERLQTMYRKYAPDRVGDVDALLQHYPGQELDLLEAMAKRYKDVETETQLRNEREQRAALRHSDPTEAERAELEIKARHELNEMWKKPTPPWVDEEAVAQRRERERRREIASHYAVVLSKPQIDAEGGYHFIGSVACAASAFVHWDLFVGNEYHASRVNILALEEAGYMKTTTLKSDSVSEEHHHHRHANDYDCDGDTAPMTVALYLAPMALMGSTQYTVTLQATYRAVEDGKAPELRKDSQTFLTV